MVMSRHGRSHDDLYRVRELVELMSLARRWAGQRLCCKYYDVGRGAMCLGQRDGGGRCDTVGGVRESQLCVARNEAWGGKMV